MYPRDRGFEGFGAGEAMRGVARHGAEHELLDVEGEAGDVLARRRRRAFERDGEHAGGGGSLERGDAAEHAVEHGADAVEVGGRSRLS